MNAQTNRWDLIPHTGAVGKFFYMAPEVYSGRQPYDGEAIDVWSLATCLFIMLFSVPLYEEPSARDGRFKAAIIDGNLEPLLRNWGFRASPQAVDLLRRMYAHDPRQRITIPEILAHPFMNV